MTSPEFNDQQLLKELTPSAETYLGRHLSTSREWFPHELVPYSLGQDFEPGYTWNETESHVKEPAVRDALFVNLLTEDNLPYYFQTIDRMFGREGVWRTWSTRWTAEENRHSIAIRDYLTVTRTIDPVELERARMAQVGCGEVPEPETVPDGFVYVALQELATRIAHFNTGDKLPDTTGKKVMKRVGTDENFHYLFYRDLTTDAIKIDPSLVVKAIERQVKGFEMPGTGIVGFKERSAQIALSGIFGFNELLEKVFKPVLYTNWKIDKLEGLDPQAEKSLEKIDRRLRAMGRAAAIETEAREEYQANLKNAA